MQRYPPPPGFTGSLQKLDNERVKYMKNAEKKCRKRRMGGVDFSPEVIIWKNRRGLWNSVIRWHKGEWINCTIIKRRETACGIQRPLSTTLIEAKRGGGYMQS